MYFSSRLQAGRMLAAQLVPDFRYENCAVIALDDGGVMVGAQIASQLHCVLTLLLSAPITLPRETEAIGGITVGGSFSFNNAYSPGEIEEMVSEYRGVIEEEKLTKLHEMNHLLGSGGLTSKELLRHHNIILVSDGLKTSFEIDMAVDFLKPIPVEKLIVATPLSSVPAIDRIHIMADKIFCLDVVAEYIDTPHYYDQQDIPDHDTIIKTIESIVLHWQ